MIFGLLSSFILFFFFLVVLGFELRNFIQKVEATLSSSS
jgi:hypothetical protein